MNDMTAQTLLSRQLQPGNPCMGIPDFVAVDNGLDLTSLGFRQACESLGIEVGYMPVRTPWYKGVIERFGKTFNTRIIHWLPGTTLGGDTKGLDYDARKESRIKYDDLERLVAMYINNVHPLAPRRDKPGTPRRRWLQGVALWPVRLPAERDVFDVVFTLTITRTLGQDGIRYSGLYYNSDELAVIRNRISEESRVVCKFDPCDIRWIYVLDPRDDSPLRVPCTSEFSVPRPLAFHRMARAAARLQGRNPDDAAELTRAERTLRREIQAAALRGKKALRRMEAELLSQSGEAEMDNEGYSAETTVRTSSPAALSLVDELFEASRADDDA